MRQSLARTEVPPLLWIDVTDPSRAELDELASEHALSTHLLRDCLEPGHLPKHETFGRFTFVIVRTFDPAAAADDGAAPSYQDVRKHAERLYFVADELLDDVNNLITLQLALASHQTSEVMRLLTIFSVFFLPLTFIVGVYGMNFEHMPELRQRWAYPAVWGVMGATVLAIFLWFRKRGWLG